MNKYFLFLSACLILWACNRGTTGFNDWESLNDAYQAVNIETSSNLDGAQKQLFDLLKKNSQGTPGSKILINYPLPESVFPPDFTSPVFLWKDQNKTSNIWYLVLEFGGEQYLHTISLNNSQPDIEIDSSTISELTQIPAPTTSITWKAGPKLWKTVKEHSLDKNVTLHIYGFSKNNLNTALSHGSVAFTTSRDSVKAPIFYRDVPIMPSRNTRGKIKPLSKSAQFLIKWRLKDVSRPHSKIVMEKIHSCANCHSFSTDGKTIGLDIDGPQSDKGSYALKPLDKNIKVELEDLLSWNYDFKEKPKGSHTLGFLSQVSPTGNYVVTTVNEKLYVRNYLRPDFIQVFFPTRGVLAYYDKKKDKINYLPGAIDPQYVHCDAVWTPDEKYIVFARAMAKDPYVKGQAIPEKAGDPEETQIQYNLYKMPFNDGKGGKAVAIPGASHNGMSNTFPKVTPDGKFIVFVKCKNGQLMRPDGKLWIVPIEGGDARLMNCNTSLMNSWHSFSPNGRWMVFSSKSRSFYTDMFLTHIDENGNDSPPIYIPGTNADNRAINIPEFVNIDYDSFDNIVVPAVDHFKHIQIAHRLMKEKKPEAAVKELFAAIEAAPDDKKFVAEVLVKIGWMSVDKEKGIEYMKKALTHDPEYFLAYFDMGMLYLTMGQEPEAIKSLNKALDLKPNDGVSMGKLADIFATTSNPNILDINKALKLAEKANELTFFRHKLLLLTYARVLSENKNFSGAIKHLDQSITIFKNDEDIEMVEKLYKERQHYQEKISYTEFQYKRG